ncbi:MAG: hypothetical protein EGQ63_06980 [Clostridiales bacterium]|nr:hypothetical protein [Clostridiales bacterium]
MNKNFKITFCVTFAIMIGLAAYTFLQLNKTDQNTKQNNYDENMPEIVFAVLQYTDNRHLWVIDKEGNVYHRCSDIYDNDLCVENLMNPDGTRTDLLDRFQRMGTTNKDITCKQYNLVQQMLYANQYGEYQYTSDEACIGMMDFIFWYACCYDEHGNLKIIELSERIEPTYYSQSPYARGIADWIVDVIQDYDGYETMNYYR